MQPVSSGDWERIMLIPIYLALCLLVAFLARKRGLGFLAYFLLSIVLTPLAPLLMLLLTTSSGALQTSRSSAGATCSHCNHDLKQIQAVDYCAHCGRSLA